MQGHHLRVNTKTKIIKEQLQFFHLGSLVKFCERISGMLNNHPKWRMIPEFLFTYTVSTPYILFNYYTSYSGCTVAQPINTMKILTIWWQEIPSEANCLKAHTFQCASSFVILISQTCLLSTDYSAPWTELSLFSKQAAPKLHCLDRCMLTSPS